MPVKEDVLPQPIPINEPETLWNEDGLTLTGLNVLREPTPPEEVKQRPALNKGGAPVMHNGVPLMLDYIDARFVMDRLDSCAGPQNWQTTYQDVHGGGVRCTLAIRVMGQWVTKTDVGDASSIEPIKGAHSDALKRAAVQWGIARDLYDDRAEAAGPAQQPAAAPRTAAAPVSGGNAGYRQPQAQQRPQAVLLDPATAPWACPIHHTVKVVPGGISRTTGRAYGAFYGCASKNEDGSYCNEKAQGIAVEVGSASPDDGLPF